MGILCSQAQRTDPRTAGRPIDAGLFPALSCQGRHFELTAASAQAAGEKSVAATLERLGSCSIDINSATSSPQKRARMARPAAIVISPEAKPLANPNAGSAPCDPHKAKAANTPVVAGTPNEAAAPEGLTPRRVVTLTPNSAAALGDSEATYL
jgi:hypothetical protein